MSMNQILECNSLTKQYSGFTALSNVNLSIQRGRIVGLLGPNGSGKTTFIKLLNGLLVPSHGELFINGKKPGVETKKIVSYLPDKNYLNNNLKVSNLIHLFEDFYEDFRPKKAYEMLERLNISPDKRMKHLSKGTKEKVQLILVMSREAQLYCLDEPIGGVDPASRDYILNTIISNYNEDATVIISTHLIADIENILDDIILLQNGNVVRSASVDDIRSKEGKSIDALFREVFRC